MENDNRLLEAKQRPITGLLSVYGITYKKAGASEVKIICPHPDHKDTDASCFINTNTNLFKCHGCGWKGSAIDFVMGVEGVGIPQAIDIILGTETKREPLKPVTKKEAGKKEYSPAELYKTKQYDYVDEQGMKVYASIRYDYPDGSKDFRLAHYNGKVLVLGLSGDVRRVPYGLDEFPQHDEIWMVEGEKCADALLDLGIYATCFAGGSKAWKKDNAKFFAGKRVVLLPDNDKTGREFMKQASLDIGEVAENVRALDLGTPRDPKGFDVFDKIKEFKDKGMSPAEIRARLVLLKRACLYVHEGETVNVLDYNQMQAEYQLMLTMEGFDLSEYIPELAGKVRKIIPGDCLCFMGDTGSGKTSLLQAIAQWVEPSTVLFFNIELATGVYFERTESIASEVPASQVEENYMNGDIQDRSDRLGHIYSVPISSLTMEGIREQFWRWVRFKKVWPEWVMVDYLQLIKSLGPRYERMSDISEDMRILAKELNTRIAFTSQKSRPPKNGKPQEDKQPTMHDAKDSGGIENSASLMIDVRSHPQHPDVKIGTVLKNTRGVAGFQFEMKWIGECTKFVAGGLEQPDAVQYYHVVDPSEPTGGDDEPDPF